jgi:putative FmdB family regulatory protein
MPTYDYECDACGYRFEMFQTFSERVKRKCPKCGKMRLRRLIGSGSGIIFKGSGFYETDYKRNNKGKPDKPSDSTGSSGKKSE